MHGYTTYHNAQVLNNEIYVGGAKGILGEDTVYGTVHKFDRSGNLVWEKDYYSHLEDVRIAYMTSDDSTIY